MTKSIVNSRILLALSLCLSLGIGLSCRGNKKSNNGGSGVVSENVETDNDKILLKLEGAEPGLSIILSDGETGGSKVATRPVASASKLDDKRVASLLGRLPKLLQGTGDTTDFAFRERSLPAPRTGKSVKQPFPAKPVAVTPTVGGGALEVTRYAPEGDVPLVPHLSVSFSKPMVAITSHEDSLKNLPVTLSPTPPGNWRWIGTKTLLFDPDVRFPMATKYSVEIAKGTKAANGEVLAEAKTFTFTTPTPTMERSYPQSGPQDLEPTIFVLFDQRIDPDAVLAKMSITASSSKHPLRMASESEIEEDKAVFGMVEAEKKKDRGRRWIAVRPEKPLPKDERIVVTIGAGTSSAEGPRTTKSAQSFNFRTYAPLKIERSQCAWGGDCPPGSALMVRFNNPLDEEDFDPESILVSPTLARMRAQVQHNSLSVAGNTIGRTTYTVTVPAGLKDRFGQTFGIDKELTFRIGKAHPQLFGSSGLTIADPLAKTATYDLHSINIRGLDVQVYKVEPKDWETFTVFMQGNPRRPKPAPGKKVADIKLKLSGEADRMIDSSIDLSKALGANGKGHAVVVVEPTTWPDRYKPRLITWVQATDIGIDAFSDASDLIAWTTNLADGKPLSDVDVSITHTSKRASSDSKGLATLPLDSKRAKKGQHQLILARKGDDVAFLPENTSWWNNSSAFTGHAQGDALQWFVFDDRGMYKPGESVSVKGWVRTRQNREGGDIAGPGKASDLSYTLHGPRGNKMGEGKAKLTAQGGFDFSLKLPKTANLGYARIEMKVANAPGGAISNHGFQIQEFRRPEFEVTSKVSQGPYIVGKGADVTVDAKYYAGGPLAGADVAWSVHSTPTSFTPPERGDYSFGQWIPWWGWGRHGGMDGGVPNNYQNHKAKTDAGGKQVLHMDFVSVKPPRPMSVIAQASVMDVNRQAWATSSTLLVHPSDLYIGLKRDRYFVQKGEPIKIDGVVVNQDGAMVPGTAATIRAVRLEWEYKQGEYKEVERDAQLCQVTTTDAPFHCEFKTPEGGRYKIMATVADEHSRPNQSEITTWVSGGKQPPNRNVTQEMVTLIPDKKEYAAGDTAKIMVQAPFFPADAVLSIRRSGIVRTERFTMKTASHTIEVPITEAQVPNIYVQVDLVGSAERIDDKGVAQPALPRRPAYAVGTLNLAIPPTNRTLKVTVTPANAKVAPGEKTSVAIVVRDAKGNPVKGAELTAIVVDESVLALSGYTTPDPIAAFYGQRPSGGRDFHQRQWLKLATPDVTKLANAEGNVPDNGVLGGVAGGDFDKATESAAMEDGAAPPPPSPMAAVPAREQRAKNSPGAGSTAANNAPITVRKNFDALAAFAPTVITDANGNATVRFETPDNLTRYRIMVVAASGKNNFGKGESNLTARMPLMVRPSPPRFLNFGDRFELPVVLQNQTDSDMKVEVAIRATNAALTAGAGRSLVVPANDRVEVRFPAAAEMAGVARFQVAASSSAFNDANEFSLPVWTPATTEAFATYGEIDKSKTAISQPVRMPPGVVEKFGGLDVSMSSTQLQALTDAYLYLVQYPYECSEQTASRIMGVAALRDVLTAFESKDMPKPAEVIATVTRDIERLSSLQNWDGGFAFWMRGHESWPYISIHAAHALTRAKAKGFDVPQGMLDKSRTYLRKIEQHIPYYYSLRTKRMLRAYALYVRKRMGDTDIAEAKKLFAEAGLKGMPLEGLGWLMSAMHGDASSKGTLGKIHRHLSNKVTETAGAANWVESYSDDAHLVLHSSRRVDAVLLEALMEEKPKDALISKVVRGLLAHRKRGRWGNTQENVFVLLAMDAYFQAYEKATPNFVARMWLGDDFAGETQYRKRSTDRNETNIPMSYLAGKGDQNLVISKEGKGRLYYRIGMTYAPKSLKLEAADHGFAIERSYEAVDDAGDVTRLADGTWKVKAGAKVRVRLTMVAENRRYHVALVDALPAGLEPMNPALAVTGTVPQDAKEQARGGRFWWWSRTWYEHQNMRDERVEAFSSLLWAGVHKYDYVTRATTPGRFVVPPAKAEEMYSPETFGRSSSDVLIVE
tara:strand:+ start:20356 stop:26469 length:6114 start_codon:yes stop_codon:yes gene_type:complete